MIRHTNAAAQAGPAGFVHGLQATTTDVTQKTIQRYVSLLEQVFLVAALRPRRTNALKRIVKTPKLHCLDCSLLAAVRGQTFDKLKMDRGEFGGLLESFVFSKILKLMSALEIQLSPFHSRDQNMHEVEIVPKRDDGMIVGIEVKASATVRSGDFAGLRTLDSACGARFSQEVVLYDSVELV